MKNVRNIVIGIIIGIVLTVTANATVQEYILKKSDCKIVVDGVEVKGELPLLIMEPGFNYIPAAEFRSICDKIGVGFEYDVPTKEIRITTKRQAEPITGDIGDEDMNEPRIETLTDITDMNVDDMGMGYFYSDGEKYITGVSVAAAIAETKSLGIEIRVRTFIFKKSDNSIVLDNIPVYGYIDANGNPRSCIKYDYFVNTILPIIEAEKESEKEAE